MSVKVKARFVDVDVEGDAEVVLSSLGQIVQGLFNAAGQPAIESKPPQSDGQLGRPAELPEPMARRARAVAPAPSTNGAVRKPRVAPGGGQTIGQRAIEYLLAHGESSTVAVAEGLGLSDRRATVYQALTTAMAQGQIEQPNRGFWRAIEGAHA